MTNNSDLYDYSIMGRSFVEPQRAGGFAEEAFAANVRHRQLDCINVPKLSAPSRRDVTDFI